MKLSDAIETKKFGVIHKLENYLPEYDFCFGGRRDSVTRLFEIGVSQGGSLAAWQEYFPKAQITGLDINEACKRFENERAKVYIGDQSDRDLLKKIHQEEGPFDIIIDDGGHTMRQQVISFEALFPLLKDGGIYVIEDLHTSYWPEFFDQTITAVDFLKHRIDDLHWWAPLHPRSRGFKWAQAKINGLKQRLGLPTTWTTPEPKTEYQRWIRSIYFAGSIAFIFKGETRKNAAHYW